MSSSTTSGRVRRGQVERRWRRRGELHLVPLDLPAARPASRRRRRCRRRPAPAPAAWRAAACVRRSGPAVRRPIACRRGKPHGEFAALPRPVAGGRSTPPPCISTRRLHQRQADAQPALRAVGARRPARTARRARRAAPARCRCPLSLHPQIRRRRRRPRLQRIGRPAAVYLAALFSRLASTCARRTGSPSTHERLARHAHLEPWPARLDQRARRSRPPGHDGAEIAAAPGAAAILPREMRDTSSRSSISRAMWSTWRSIMSRARLGLGGTPARRCRIVHGVADRRERVAQFVRQHPARNSSLRRSASLSASSASPCAVTSLNRTATRGPCGSSMRKA